MSTSLALGTPVPLGDLLLKQGNPGLGQPNATLLGTFGTGIRNFINQVLPNAIIIASLILLAIILLGGLSMIATAGNPEAQEKSKAAVTNAAIGFALVIGAYWIVQIFQVITGVNILKP